MTTAEAMKILQRDEQKQYEAYAYCEGLHLFSCGDPDVWDTVNEKTGETDTISYMRTVLFDRVEDQDFCDKLERAVKNAKPISTKYLKEAV